MVIYMKGNDFAIYGELRSIGKSKDETIAIIEQCNKIKQYIESLNAKARIKQV